MIKQLLFFLALILTFSSAFAQVKQAEKEMAVYNFTEAVALLQKALEKGDQEEERKVVVLLAECYRMLNDWPQEKTCYRRAISLGETSPENYFFLAQAYRVSGDYEEARRLFLQSDDLDSGKLPGRHFAMSCDSALLWLQRDPGFEVQNLALLNSPQSEFGAVVIPSGLLFTSDRLPARDPDKIYGWTGNSYLHLFLAKKSPGRVPDSFLTPDNYDEFSTQEWHDGPASFNNDFTEVFINQTLIYGDQTKRDPERTRTHLLKIYTAEMKDGKWTKPETFFINSRDYSVGHPALTPNGNTLFFVSDQPGGYGGTDIYSCKRTDNGWDSPVNLGPVINTPGNEMFPFVTEKNELWFASDFHPGFGGLDIFVTKPDEENRTGAGIFPETGTKQRHAPGKDPWEVTWEKPLNPGSPINSSYDDFSVWTDSTGNHGFFSSNRPGGAGGDDIYYFEKAQRHIRTEAPDTSWQWTVGSRQFADTSHQLPDSSITSSPHHLTTSLELNKPYTLENIYYDFDKWDIREDAKPALDSLVRIMKQYPVTVELGSYTDCRGTGEYNLDLSQKRAESAVIYIIGQGIDPGRIIAKGYGESMPVNNCSCQPGKVCSELEHQVNRRTEFRILSWGTSSAPGNR